MIRRNRLLLNINSIDIDVDIDILINMKNEEYKQLEKRSQHFFNKIQNPTNDVEKSFGILFQLSLFFADRLDALCLQNGIDLLKLQKVSGTYLKRNREINDVYPYIGSIELSEHYTNELNATTTEKNIQDIIDTLIPAHVNETYRSELEHVFSHGKIKKKRIEWKTGHKDMWLQLQHLFFKETIPHTYSTEWVNFVLTNFTKYGKEISEKSVRNTDRKGILGEYS